MPTRTDRKVWVFADYKQAEAMVVAWRGPVPKLKEWFRNGEDVHLNTAKLIGRVVQANKLKIPNGLFCIKPWPEFVKKDEERQTGKNCVHSGSYGVGSDKFALIAKIPEPIAKIVLELYYKLFPEIKSGYQTWIDKCLTNNNTIISPLGRRYTFYDRPGPDRSRSAYSLYAQNTVGDLLSLCINRINHHFNSLDNIQGEVTPWAIQQCGLDTALQIHDSVGVRTWESQVDEVCGAIKKAGEIPITFEYEDGTNDTLTIPMDFKVGPSWGEAKDYDYKS